MKAVILMALFSVLALIVMVPILSGVIRQIEPGRDRSPELQNLADRAIQIPERGPFVLAHCADPCRLGSWVKLYAGRIEQKGYLAVWAESEGDRVWYYPSDSGYYPEVAASPATVVLSDGLKLSRAHASHRAWTLKLALVDARYGREQLETLAPEHVIVADELALDLGAGR